MNIRKVLRVPRKPTSNPALENELHCAHCLFNLERYCAKNELEDKRCPRCHKEVKRKSVCEVAVHPEKKPIMSNIGTPLFMLGKSAAYIHLTPMTNIFINLFLTDSSGTDILLDDDHKLSTAMILRLADKEPVRNRIQDWTDDFNYMDGITYSWKQHSLRCVRNEAGHGDCMRLDINASLKSSMLFQLVKDELGLKAVSIDSVIADPDASRNLRKDLIELCNSIR